MSRRSITSTLLSFAAAALALGDAPGAAADYRGMTAGWPAYANGPYAAYYPQPAYYVARPTINGYAAPGYVAARPVAGTAYVPERAAYANPTYYGAYNAAPAGYRAAPAAYAAPTAAYYAPPNGTAQYVPVQANYAPANSYAVTPAGIAAAGSEAATHYGQPAAVNYVPPRFNYRTTYAPVPVYMYRPVTAYNAAAAQYSTCQQPIATTTCQTQRTRCFSWFNPFTWFHRGSCGDGGCGQVAVPTTAYCGTGGCAQPYYPTAPLVIPSTPVPVNPLPPTTVFPSAPPAGFTVPPPGTRFPTTPGLVPQGPAPQGFIPRGAAPADTRPNLGPLPGGSFGAPPAGSTIINPAPIGPTAPPGSFQTAPGTPPPGFTPVPGGFGTGANYPPSTDPYRSELTPATPPAPTGPSLNGNTLTGPSHTVFGSGYQSNVIRAPELGPALPPNVQTVPDLEAQQQPQPVNRAPQLLGPRDKTATRGDSRWAVVPAKWPSRPTTLRASQPLPVTRQVERQVTNLTPATAVYDDGGWKSAR